MHKVDLHQLLIDVKDRNDSIEAQRAIITEYENNKSECDKSDFDIDKEIHILIDNKEQGYVNHQDDRGGPTCWGITQGTARYYCYSGDMRLLTKSYAVMIYKSMFYLKPGLNKVAEVDSQITRKLFDMSVIVGITYTHGIFQRALNLFNRQQKIYRDIKMDGIIGPNTIFALKSFIEFRREPGVEQMIKVLNGMEVARFFDLAEREPSQEEFFFGWISKRIS